MLFDAVKGDSEVTLDCKTLGDFQSIASTKDPKVASELSSIAPEKQTARYLVLSCHSKHLKAHYPIRLDSGNPSPSFIRQFLKYTKISKENEIKELKQKMAQLIDRLAEKEKSESELRDSSKHIRDHFSHKSDVIEASMKDLEASVVTLTEENKALKEKLRSSKRQIAAQKAKISSLRLSNTSFHSSTRARSPARPSYSPRRVDSRVSYSPRRRKREPQPVSREDSSFRRSSYRRSASPITTPRRSLSADRDRSSRVGRRSASPRPRFDPTEYIQEKRKKEATLRRKREQKEQYDGSRNRSRISRSPSPVRLSRSPSPRNHFKSQRKSSIRKSHSHKHPKSSEEQVPDILVKMNLLESMLSGALHKKE
ncbi:hypothetical protein ADUPG1_000824 [Aduncisulcus paluster]|uniref:Uncharacterized protein n=1 Tax=Aduncisulcus paluster TaxID=2918883 RepID=A0ABQ5K829_9EUKA|nr:hypothetical protein ADUPG1_000824 [Aduncisulcus paluster]